MVFENLFRNASVHAGENPKLEVKISRKSDILEIIVQDDGPGISEEVKDRLFQKGVSTRGGGLGLFLSRQIINSISGTLDLVETSNGIGTAFKVMLPIEKEEMVIS